MTTLSPLETAKRGARQSRFVKKVRCAYDTIDPRAVAALRPHVRGLTRFIEPCAGKGDLVRALQGIGLECLDAFDIAPRADDIRQQDALEPLGFDVWRETIITNPPFDWPLLDPMISHWLRQVDTMWLLLPAVFAHRPTRAVAMQSCRTIVTIGTMRWEPGTDHRGVDFFAWYEFTRRHQGPVTFHPRLPTGKAA